MIFGFIVDASPATSGYFDQNLSILEAAKCAIELFFRHIRAENSASFILCTYPAPLVIHSKDSGEVLRAVKNINAAAGPLRAGDAFAAVFESVSLVSSHSHGEVFLGINTG